MELTYETHPNNIWRKYEQQITSLVNKHQSFRDYLSVAFPIPNLPISRMLSNGYHIPLEVYKDGTAKIEGTFTTRNVYTPFLLRTLQNVDYFVKRGLLEKKEIEQAILYELVQKDFNYKSLNNPFYFLFKNARYLNQDFNPQSNVATTAGDAMIERVATGNTFANIRTGAGTTAYAAITNTTSPDILADGAGNTWTRMRRDFFHYDTSTIGSASNVTAGVNIHKVYITARNDNFSQSIALGLSTATAAVQVASDYLSVSYIAQATAFTIASVTLNAYSTHTLNSTGDGNIQKAGITKFFTCLSCDMNNVEPTWAPSTEASVDGNLTDSASNKPILNVTWTTSSGGAAFLLNFL